MPKPAVDLKTGAKIGIVNYGSSSFAVEESRDQLREHHQTETSCLRLRAYPFTAELDDFIRRHDRIYVVEQNRDAQMLSLMKMDLDPSLITKLQSVLHYNGLPIDARSVTDGILAKERT